MPFTIRPYEPPLRTNIRERLLKEKLGRLAEHRNNSEIALQEARQRALSPHYLKVEASRIDLLRASEQKLRDGLETIRRQNVAAREAEDEVLGMSPLERVRERQGFYRTEEARNAAILGILQRERRLNAPLTREAWSRAEAIAASRRLYDPVNSQLRGSRGSAYVPRPGDFAPGFATFDDCLDAKRKRREVMFARGYGGRGYRTPKTPWPC